MRVITSIILLAISLSLWAQQPPVVPSSPELQQLQAAVSMSIRLRDREVSRLSNELLDISLQLDIANRRIGDLESQLKAKTDKSKPTEKK